MSRLSENCTTDKKNENTIAYSTNWICVMGSTMHTLLMGSIICTYSEEKTFDCLRKVVRKIPE